MAEGGCHLPTEKADADRVSAATKFLRVSQTLRGPALTTAYPPVGLRVTQAYVRLFFVPESEDGARTISLARFGNYEVRLVELVQSDGACDPPLWVELYDRNTPGSIDSCSASDLEEMVCAAEQLLSEAKQLSEGAEPGHGSGKVEQHRSNDSIRRTSVIH